MTTKTELITELKSNYPTLRVGSEEDGYVELSTEEYNATIEKWADNKLIELTETAAKENKEAAKAALLARLGITQEEANLLIGGSN
jgi:hypothetical protein